MPEHSMREERNAGVDPDQTALLRTSRARPLRSLLGNIAEPTCGLSGSGDATSYSRITMTTLRPGRDLALA